MAGRTKDQCRKCGAEWVTTKKEAMSARYEHYKSHIPGVNPEKLQGPEVGTEVIYRSGYTGPEGKRAVVTERSYVWAPGDPAYGGGIRRYDLKVIHIHGGGDVLVDDKALEVVA